MDIRSPVQFNLNEARSMRVENLVGLPSAGNAGRMAYVSGVMSVDVSGSWKTIAFLESPTFTGTPAAPTAAPGTSTTQIATTAFVAAAVTGGSVADGDKGDITVSGSGSAWTVDAGAITLAKMANLAANSIIGNNTGSPATPLALTATQVRTLLNVADGATANSADATLLARANHTGTQTASTISDFASAVAATAAVTANTAKVSNATHTGDVTGATALTIANNAVSNAKAADMANATIKGRATAGTGDPEDLTATQVRTIINVADGATANSADATLLARANHTGTQLAATISDFATAVAATAAVTANTAKVTNATHTGDVTGATALTIAADVVTNAKLANMATTTIKGRVTAGTGDPEDLTAAQVRTLINVADGANNYTHPNHSGDVTSTGDGATVIANGVVTLAKMAAIATDRLIGNITGSAATPAVLSPSQVKGMLAIQSTDISNFNTAVDARIATVVDTAAGVLDSLDTLTEIVNQVNSNTLGAVKRYQANFGDGTNTAYTITHSLGTKDVIVQIRDSATDAMVMCDVVMTSTTQITITATPAPASNALRVVVLA